MEEAIAWAVSSLTESLSYEYYSDAKKAEQIRQYMETLSGKPYITRLDEYGIWVLPKP